MSNKRKIINSYPNYYREFNFKGNCNLECCHDLRIEHADVYQAECIPVINEKIFDCITLEDFKYRIEEEGEFTVVCAADYQYDEGDPICIDKVDLYYDFIGVVEEEKKELVNSDGVIFSAKAGTGHNCCGQVFYDEFIASVVTSKYSSKRNVKEGIKSRILENDAQFYVCNLEVVLSGTIGEKPFKAISNTTPYTGPIFEDVGLDFYGVLCIPECYRKVTIHEEYDGCLTSEFATADTSYNSITNTFTASVEFLLVVEKTIYSTVNEKVVIFTIADDVIYNYDELDPVYQPKKSSKDIYYESSYIRNSYEKGKFKD